MKRIIDYLVDHSVIVNLLTVLIIVMGFLSIRSLNKEVFPNVDFNYINIRTAYTGAAAEDVEKLISIEIEREVKEVEGIEEINAMSAEGASIITLKVDPDYDVDDVLVEVRNSLADLSQSVPDEVDTPVVNKITNNRRGLITFAIYGKDELDLRKDAKYVRDELERYGPVSIIELYEYRDEEVKVLIDLDKLKQNDLTLTQVLQAIRDRQTNITAGNITKGRTEKLIRTLKEYDSAKSVEEVVLLSNDIGNKVTVKDIARVVRELEDQTRQDRANGELAIFLEVKTKSSSDVIDSSEWLKNKMKELSEARNFKFSISSDMSFYVKRRLGVLTQNGIQGIILVTLCLVLFMNFRVSLITALGAPFAFLVAFAMMDSIDVTINLISMFGLIMVLGMLVDDSIIVSEQYYQYLEMGMEPRAAAKKAAYDTLAPVTSTVLTTMVAFSSLLYMEGIMGKFMWPVPAVVIICLIASWFECFIILPGHLADFAGTTKNVEKTRWYKPLMESYRSHLKTLLKIPSLTVLTFLILFGASIVTAINMRFELFPADDVTYAYLNLKGPVGTSFERTNEKLLEIEKIVNQEIQKDELVGFRTITGYQWSKGGTPRSGSHYGSIFIELTMQDFRERKTDDILNLVSAKVKNISEEFIFSLEKIKNGPPGGKPINIEISADSIEELKLASKQIKSKLESMQEVISSEVDYELGKKQIIVDIDEAQARRLGVSNLQIGMELRNAFEGLVATTIKKGDEDVDIVVRLEDQFKDNIETLNKLKITNQQGRLIPLTQMAKFVEKDGSFIIRRYERKRTFAISGEVDRKVSTSQEVNKKIRPYLDEVMKSYSNMSYQLTGENKDTQDSLESFKKALVGSMFIIFILLVIQFSSLGQPLIVMSAIPFGLIGVVASFKLLGLPLGFMALMGMLGLVGVVINDSIVLVTFINRYLKERGFKVDSLVDAAVSRFRPVILTTVTTVAGLLPVAHMPGGDPFLKPMATSFAYGLLFSTTITLIFVPASYLLYVKVLQFFKKAPAFEA